MRNLIVMMAACLFVFSACMNEQKTSATAETLETVMAVPATVKAGEPVPLTFTVLNHTGKEQEFCKWHTPFEGFIAAFLDIKGSDGAAVAYRGAMAKRIMPPPAEAYIKIPAGDSVTVDIDLLKGYDLSKPGKYHIVYQAGGVSGLEKVNELDLVITE